VDAPETDVNPNNHIIIPNNKKPYINKDINFELFVDVLTEEVDK
jgi:hypothetical protein